MEESIKYFQGYEGYFWQWETDQDAMEHPDDEFNVLAIPHVSVIAYRKHVLEVLSVMADGGLPPYGALLLVLYASGDFRFSNFDGLNYYFTKTERTYGGLADKQAVLQFLQSVSGLPKKLKSGENKILLLQTVFQNCHNQLAASKARLIITRIHNKVILRRCAMLKPFDTSAYARDLSTLQLLNEKFPDSASIIRAMQGLPELPQPKEEIVEEELVAVEKDFIDQLIEEPKTFEVGQLIRHIWSGLKIPMQHFSPGDQPIGGISDMTNKGNIDRMLLSEFAYDDDIFLQRVANNEALYIQREIPPEKNIFERVIIIDISLRNWGTPKILALSAALAIARHPKSKDECRIFLAGNKAREIKYDKVEDVIDALALVGPVPDCSAGMLDFFNRETGSRKQEVFLLTAEDSFKLPAVQKTISDFRDQFKFVICFGTNGNIQFFKMQKGAKRLLQTIILPLEELWKKLPAKKASKPKVESLDYPILFTAHPNELGGFYVDGGYYFLSRKKILYRTYLGAEKKDNSYHYSNIRGWEPVVKNISLKPQGAFALGKNELNELLLCQYHPGDKVLSVLNLVTKKYLSIKCKERQTYKLLFYETDFYLSEVESRNFQKVRIGEDALGFHPSNLTQELQKSYETQQDLVKQVRGYTKDILTNHNSVGITNDGCLQFSKHTLLMQHTNLCFIIKRAAGFKAVAVRRGNEFCFADGSTVKVDAEGMITLRSSDESLPDIFIPSCVGVAIAAATPDVFCGAAYYLPQFHQFKIEKVEAFYEHYIGGFIQQIITHAVTA